MVDPAEVPSARWGWSGESPKVFRAFGGLVIVALLGMLIGNHKGHIEDIYLVGFAVLIAGLIVRDVLVRRRPR